MFSIAKEPTMPLAQKCEMYHAYCFPPISGYLYQIVIRPTRVVIGRTRLCCHLRLFWSIHTCLPRKTWHTLRHHCYQQNFGALPSAGISHWYQFTGQACARGSLCSRSRRWFPSSPVSANSHGRLYIRQGCFEEGKYARLLHVVYSPQMETREDDIDRQIKFLRRRSCTCGESTLTLPNLLCFSFVFNIVFVVLFVVVFIQLEDVQTRLAKLESPVIEDPNKLTASEGDESPFALRRANSTLTPFHVITANVTTPPILIKVRAIWHCPKVDRNICEDSQSNEQSTCNPTFLTRRLWCVISSTHYTLLQVLTFVTREMLISGIFLFLRPNRVCPLYTFHGEVHRIRNLRSHPRIGRK